MRITFNRVFPLMFLLFISGIVTSFGSKKELSKEDSLFLVYDFAPEVNDSIIKKRVESINSDIKIIYNQEVQYFIDYFALRRRDYMRKMLERAPVYFPMFEEVLAKDSMPEAIKYLTIVESGINPKAKSHVGALGLWQFMPATGKMYGLDYDWYIDERMDPYKATQAASKYLKALHRMFNDWELALAAYNCGPGNVRKAIRRSGGKQTFWEIYDFLPKETRSYVPQFMAVNYVMRFADEHNIFIEEHHQEHLPEFEVITVNQYFNIDEFAKKMNICIETLEKLNPEISRNIIPTHWKNYELRIPKTYHGHFLSNQDEILTASLKKGDENLNYKPSYNPSANTEGKNKIVHTVRGGDVLGKISQMYSVKVSDIKLWNGLHNDNINIGQKLVIYKNPSYFKQTAPTPEPVVAAKTTTTKSSQQTANVYTVQPGDSLWKISQKFELTVEKIKQLNGLKNNDLKPGMVLKLG